MKKKDINYFKKFWWVIYLVFAFLFAVLYPVTLGRAWNDEFGFGGMVLFWFIIAPLFFIIGLILNIIKHNQNQQSVFSDWKFWAWLIPLIIGLVILIYILAHNSGLINF